MNGRSESTNLFVTVQTLVMRIMGKEDRSYNGPLYAQDKYYIL